MGADNYVVVRKFGDRDFRWGHFSASDDDPDMSNKIFRHGPFKTPREAAQNAHDEISIIEYGIQFEDGCLITDQEDDTKRLDWLEKHQGFALVSDDRKHWACGCDGLQNVPAKVPADISTTFFIRKKEWKKSIRAAIDFAMKGEK